MNHNHRAATLLAVPVLAVSIAACGSSSSGNAAAAPSTFTATGVLRLFQGVDNVTKLGKTCQGAGGYSDIAEGAQVVVQDAKGTKVGLGALGTGKSIGFGCAFRFQVTDIPDSGDVYSVEVTHRGEISFKQENAKSISLILGT